MAAGVDPTRLIVDFKDDVSAETLANNGFTEIPISDYSAKDRLYRIDFATADEAAAAKAKLSHDPSVESVDYESFASIPPDEEAQEEQAAANAASGSMEAECQAARRRQRVPERRLLQVPVAPAPDRACRTPGSAATARASWSRSSTPASPRSATSRRPSSSPATTSSRNNDNAADDHGHGTHVAGTIAQSTNNKLGVAGVAYGAAIMPLKVLSARGSGSVAGIAQAHPLGGRPRRQRHQHEPRAARRGWAAWPAP